jgi:hypothetical protein
VEGDRHAEAVLRRLCGGIAALALALVAGCGGGAHSSLASSCDRQRSALAQIGPVASLAQAERAIDRVIPIEARARDDLRAANARPALVESYELALADARRLRATLAGADPTQTMSPLQIGPSGGRRTVERARLLMREACG